MGIVVFDLDDTLVDRALVFREWAEGFAEAYGMRGGAVEQLIDLDDDGDKLREDFFASVRSQFNLRMSVDQLINDYRHSYASGFRTAEESIDAIRRLREAGWKVAVVTNGPSSQISKLESSGLTDVIDASCVSAVVGSRKPDPSIFRLAAERCGRSLSGWMVGDSPYNDIQGGRSAGLRTIWIRRSRPWPEDSFFPDFEVDTVGEAVDLVLSHPPT